MSRSPVVVRAATLDDVSALRSLWQHTLRAGTLDEQLADVTHVVSDAMAQPNRMIAVAEHDGQVAGAVFIEATTLTPLNLEPAVLVISPQVSADNRRKGVGSALMDAAVRFAEQRGIAHVVSAANADGRDANRFMARLSLAPRATLRSAATTAVRAKLSSRRPAAFAAGATTRQIDRVLAARRSRRERVPG